MTDRAQELSASVDRQIAELIDLLSTLDQAALRRPCPGREKLGDGTIGAAARHTADNYQRIAGFVQTSDRMSATQQPAEHSGHRIPKFLRVLGHGPQDHANHDHARSTDEHDSGYTAENIDLDVVVEQLGASRDALGRIAQLTDIQLDAIPPKDGFRFCDGQRTLEQVLTSLLKHQATRSMLSKPPSPKPHAGERAAAGSGAHAGRGTSHPHPGSIPPVGMFPQPRSGWNPHCIARSVGPIMKRPEVNITPLERAGRIVLGASAAIAGLALLAAAGTTLAVVLEGLLILAGLDLVVTGALGHCPLYHKLGHIPPSLRRPA